MHGKRKIVGVDNVVDENEYKIFEEAPLIAQSIRDMVDDEPNEPCYIRDDHHEGEEFNQEMAPRKKKKKKKCKQRR